MYVEGPPWRCRSCAAAVEGTILDLGSQPSADLLVEPGTAIGTEVADRLALGICPSCWLVQLAPTTLPLETGHGHGTAFSSSTLGHLEAWADEAIRGSDLDVTSLVVDIAAGSGHLLAPFRDAGVRVRAIESDPLSARACRLAGIPTTQGPIASGVAASIRAADGAADLVLVNHALAHIDDLADAMSGIAILLKPGGTVVIEFHHLLRLVTEAQFDAVCHAHRSYLSLTALLPLLARHGLEPVDATPMETHGGTVRVLAAGSEYAAARSTSGAAARVSSILESEQVAGLDRLAGFDALGPTAAATCARFRSFLEQAHTSGRTVVGYGAPSRAVTLCNAAGITSELLPFTVDRSPDKQGRLLPGCRIPIREPGAIEAARPDLILILPWTLRDEIVEQLGTVATWGGRFVVALPTLEVFGP